MAIHCDTGNLLWGVAGAIRLYQVNYGATPAACYCNPQIAERAQIIEQIFGVCVMAHDNLPLDEVILAG